MGVNPTIVMRTMHRARGGTPVTLRSGCDARPGRWRSEGRGTSGSRRPCATRRRGRPEAMASQPRGRHAPMRRAPSRWARGLTVHRGRQHDSPRSGEPPSWTSRAQDRRRRGRLASDAMPRLPGSFVVPTPEGPWTFARDDGVTRVRQAIPAASASGRAPRRARRLRRRRAIRRFPGAAPRRSPREPGS